MHARVFDSWLPSLILCALLCASGCDMILGLEDTAGMEYVKASNTDPGDRFGWSVALSANGDTLAVGAYEEDSAGVGVGLGGNPTNNGAAGSGAVYVFQRDGLAWVQQAYVKASNTGVSDLFGASVALSANGDTLAVGAYGEDSAATGVGGNQINNNAQDSGAVYMFQRDGSAWAQQAYVKASNTGADDQFGISVALSASGDTLAVGAYSEASTAVGVGGNQTNNNAPDSGAVYVFQRSGSVWVQQAYAKASNTDAGDQFGVSVALSASGDTLAVGAYSEDSSATAVDGNQANNSAGASGAVYVFQRSGSAWAQEAYVKASNTGADDQFGVSVALSTSGDTLAVGAYMENSAATGLVGDQASNSATHSGSVYVFQRSGSTWAQQAYVKASNTGAGDELGDSVALSSSGDTLAVGAHSEDSADTGLIGDQANNSAGASGAVYVFQRSGSAWAQEAYVKAPNTDAGDEFGFSVALSGSGDTLAVGAYQEDSATKGVAGEQADNSAEDSGAAYLYRF